MGVINNYFQLLLITFQISYELKLPKIIINTLNTDIEIIFLGCCQCLLFPMLISFYEKMNALCTN